MIITNAILLLGVLRRKHLFCCELCLLEYQFSNTLSFLLFELYSNEKYKRLHFRLQVLQYLLNLIHYSGYLGEG